MIDDRQCVRAPGLLRPRRQRPGGFARVQAATDRSPMVLCRFRIPRRTLSPMASSRFPVMRHPRRRCRRSNCRGSFEAHARRAVRDAAPPPNAYGYVPLRQAEPVPSQAQQPQLRMTNGDAIDAPMRTVQRHRDRLLSGCRSRAARICRTIGSGPGDKIRVTVFGESDLSGEYQVDGSGMVRLPLIGTLRAAGYTAPALEQAIAAALADGYLKYPRVNVEIATYRPFYIIGAVNRPGQYPYVDHMNALNAVALAGGFTDQAVESTLYIRHEGSTKEAGGRRPANSPISCRAM